ncbi:hypothetical protein HYT54_00730 [Candidatus Woesearchaeota archaeon]|nr:hypothetical protein [Candidatus Woesearchaeota archaeon]
MEYHTIDVNNPNRSASFWEKGILYRHIDRYGAVPLRLPDGMPFNWFAVEHSDIFPDIGRVLLDGSGRVIAGDIKGADECLSALLEMNEGSRREPLGLPNATEYVQALMTSVLMAYASNVSPDLRAVRAMAAKYGIDFQSIVNPQSQPQEAALISA